MKKKRSKNIYDTAITMENIEAIWKIIRRTCKNKRELFIFNLNLNANLFQIWKTLKERKYKPCRYRCFMIFEPKPRLVMSQVVADKIVNHFITNYYLIPYLESSLINSNVATRKNKGSKYAMDLIKKYFNKIIINNPNKEIYCLKIDISKYFYSIDHEILLNMLRKRIKDKDVINIIEVIINETNSNYINDYISKCRILYNMDIPYYVDNKGLSIGAMTSQFLAIYFFNDLDHLIKEKLKCKYYIRYMDDLLILDTDKNKLKEVYKIVKEEIAKLKLKVNKKSNFYRCSHGFSFLGYTYKLTNNKLFLSCNKKNIKKIKKRLRVLKENDEIKYLKSLASYNGYLKQVYKVEKRRYSMDIQDIILSYRKKYNKALIMIKEGSFYKTLENDAVILWYLFDYKFYKNSISFGSKPYDKIIDKLKKVNISFIIIDKEKILLNFLGDDAIYDMYLELSSKSYKKYIREKNILDKLEQIISNHYDACNEIEMFLEELGSKYK